MYIYNWPQCRDFPRSFKHAEMLANKSALVLLYKSAHIIYPDMEDMCETANIENIAVKVHILFTPDTGIYAK